MPDRRWYTSEAVIIHQWGLTAGERLRALRPLERYSFFSLSSEFFKLRDWQLAEMAAATATPALRLANRNSVREQVLRAFETGQLVALRRLPLRLATSTGSATGAGTGRLAGAGTLAGSASRSEVTASLMATFAPAHFETDKAFPLPGAIPTFRDVATFAQREPNRTLLVIGHTDAVGVADYNLGLSDDRAAAVAAYFRNDVEAWLKLWGSAPSSKKWGTREDQHMLHALPWGAAPYLARAPADGVNADVTKAIRTFQRANKLPETGRMDEGTRRKLVFDYMAADGTTTPAQVQIRTLACGERHLKVQTQKASAENRRVEVFAFASGDIRPPPEECRDGKHPGCTAYGQWMRYAQELPPGGLTEVTLTTPTLLIPEEPGASIWVKATDLNVYLVRFASGAPVVTHFVPDDGKPPGPVNTGEAYFYFSHRGDLTTNTSLFAEDKSKLPLIGPIQLEAGDKEVKVDAWSQDDWVIVRGGPLDGATADSVEMVEQRDDYVTTMAGITTKNEPGHWILGKPTDKDNQERWKGNAPGGVVLVKLSASGRPFWVGTLSAAPAPKLKLLLIKGGIGAGSYNELVRGEQNLDLPGHHRYDRALVEKLEALKRSSPEAAAVDALPTPPARFILPGDCCWQDQGQTNNCGAYSFSTAMNYWFPYTNYVGGHDGSWYSKTKNVPSLINGARTPRNIEKAAKKFNVNGLDRDAEDLDKEHALKLLKCWVMAGVPTLVLVKENSASGLFDRMTSYHWKTVVGWDGDRLFMNNSGGDQEVLNSMRVVTGFDYDHAPVGNDVDPIDTHWDKWKAGGGDIVDLCTSVDECTFIPVYPKDAKFGGDGPR